MKENFSPGRIAYNKQTYFPVEFPVYGIILPKDAFVKLVKKKQILVHTPKISLVRDMEPKDFMKDNRFIGVYCFGDIYSPYINKVLNFEIFDTNSHVGTFDLKQLPLIKRIREYSFAEMDLGEPIHTRGVNFDMGVVIDYFSGDFKGRDLEKEGTNKNRRDLVSILRACKFKEENIFN